MDPSTAYDEAISLMESGRLEEAITAMERITVEAPEYALAHAALSVLYGKTGRHEEAVEEARKVCELDPDDPFSFMAKSIVCQRAGLIREAEEAMSQAMHKQWLLRQQEN